MLTKYVVGINWVDFLVIGLIARMCYIGIKTGVGIEAFKLFNLWLTTVIAFQIYTTPLSDLLNTRVPALPLDAGDVFVFVSLVTIITLLIRIVRESFFLLVKVEAHSTLDKWGGFAIGLLRGFWISSIVLFVLIISTVGYLETSAKTSLFGRKVIYFAPQVYKGSYLGLTSKFFPQVQLNEEVFKALER